jgi:hypothetical protein
MPASADIVTTVTADKCNAVILTPPMITPGMHLNAVIGDCPGRPAPRRRAAHVGRAGRRRYERSASRRDPADACDFAVTQLSGVIRSAATGRATPDEITIFDSVGTLEDYSALRLHSCCSKSAVAPADRPRARARGRRIFAAPSARVAHVAAADRLVTISHSAVTLVRHHRHRRRFAGASGAPRRCASRSCRRCSSHRASRSSIAAT